KLAKRANSDSQQQRHDAGNRRHPEGRSSKVVERGEGQVPESKQEDTNECGGVSTGAIQKRNGPGLASWNCNNSISRSRALPRQAPIAGTQPKVIVERLLRCGKIPAREMRFCLDFQQRQARCGCPGFSLPASLQNRRMFYRI